MSEFPSRLCRIGVFHYLCKLERRFNRLFGSCFYDVSCDLSCKLFFTVVKEYSRKFALGVSVHHFVGRYSLRSIHSHIKRRVFHIAESAFGIVELIAAHSKVEQYSVHLANSYRVKLGDEIFVIVVDEGHSVAVRCKSFACRLQSVFVFVDAYQSAIPGQSFDNLD